MKVYFIALYRKAEPVAELCSVLDLSSIGRWYRAPAEELLRHFCLTEAQKIQPNQFESAPQQSFQINCLGPRHGIVSVMVTEQDYPKEATKPLLAKVVDDFVTEALHGQDVSKVTSVPWPRLNEIMKKYEDPHEADSMLKLKKELEDTKTILYKTVDAMLDRGVALDQLVAKSDNLSMTSKQFYTAAKKQNSCCSVM